MSVLLVKLTPGSTPRASRFGARSGLPHARSRESECDGIGGEQAIVLESPKGRAMSPFGEQGTHAVDGEPPAMDRRRAKTRSCDFDERASGVDFARAFASVANENAETLENYGFRTFGRAIAKGGREGEAREGETAGAIAIRRLESKGNEDESLALSRMNSLMETKVLTSTGLVRQTSVSNDGMFDFEGHFEFEQIIGASQNSEVWLVTSKTSGEAFVIKKFTHSFTTDKQRTVFKREVEAAKLLPEHPNIVRYYRSWQQDQLFYIQMEHCACGSLANACARLPPGMVVAEIDIWRLAVQIASGLAHMHRHRVLHLDIKPENIYIDIEGTYKIGDLGLACALDEDWDWEEGDGGYVAPELLNLFPGEKPTPAADVFSFGVSVYEISSGCKFPRGATPRAQAPGLPEGRSSQLSQLIHACLMLNPLERPSAAEVAQFATTCLTKLEKS